jgi:hypothetical protein
MQTRGETPEQRANRESGSQYELVRLSDLSGARQQKQIGATISCARATSPPRKSFRSSRHEALQLFGPVQHHVDLSRRHLLRGDRLEHQEPLAVRGHIECRER